MAKKTIEITGVTVAPDNIAATAVESFTALVPTAAGLLSAADERLLIAFTPAIVRAAGVLQRLKTATEGKDYRNPEHVAEIKKIFGPAGIGQPVRKEIDTIHKEQKAGLKKAVDQIDLMWNILKNPVKDAEKELEDFCLRGEREQREAQQKLHHERYSVISEYFRPGYADSDYGMHFPNGFGAFSDEQFQIYLEGAKSKHAERLKAIETARLQAEREETARKDLAALRAAREAVFRPYARWFNISSDELLEVPVDEWDGFLLDKQRHAAVFEDRERSEKEQMAVLQKAESEKRQREFEARQKEQQAENARLQKIADEQKAEADRIKAENARLAKEALAVKQAEAAEAAKKKAEAEALAKGGDKEKIAAIIPLFVAFMGQLNPKKTVYGTLSSPEGIALFNRFRESQVSFWKEMTEFIK